MGLSLPPHWHQGYRHTHCQHFIHVLEIWTQVLRLRLWAFYRLSHFLSPKWNALKNVRELNHFKIAVRFHEDNTHITDYSELERESLKNLKALQNQCVTKTAKTRRAMLDMTPWSPLQRAPSGPYIPSERSSLYIASQLGFSVKTHNNVPSVFVPPRFPTKAYSLVHWPSGSISNKPTL